MLLLDQNQLIVRVYPTHRLEFSKTKYLLHYYPRNNLIAYKYQNNYQDHQYLHNMEDLHIFDLLTNMV